MANAPYRPDVSGINRAINAANVFATGAAVGLTFTDVFFTKDVLIAE